jgi:hypothetical protein
MQGDWMLEPMIGSGSPKYIMGEIESAHAFDETVAHEEGAVWNMQLESGSVGYTTISALALSSDRRLCESVNINVAHWGTLMLLLITDVGNPEAITSLGSRRELRSASKTGRFK